jgi:telomere length regulation protein
MDLIQLGVEVGSLVQKAKALLKAQPTHVDSYYDAIREILSLVPSSGWIPTAPNFKCHTTEAQKVFIQDHYCDFAECLLDHLNPAWLQPDDKGRRLIPLFDSYFLNGPSEDALIVLSRGLGGLRAGVCMFHCIGLVESLMRNGCVEKILRKHCCEQPLTESIEDLSGSCLSRAEHLQLQHWQSLLSAVASLPDVVLAAESVKETADFFYRDSYIPLISAQILRTLHAVRQLLLDERACSVRLIAMVVGKLSMAGYAETIWKSMLPELESLCLRDFLWRRIVQRIIADMPERCVETAVTQLASQTSSYLCMSALLGTLPAASKKMAYVLTHKLLLVRYFEGVCASRVLRNVIGCLSGSDQLRPQFTTAFRSLLIAWSDGSSLRHRPVQQSLYLCKGVVTCVAFASPEDIEEIRDELVRHLLDGLPGYLGSSVTDVRHMGCFVAEKLSTVVHRKTADAQPLCFDLEMNDVVRSLSELVVRPDVAMDDSNGENSEKVKNEEAGAKKSCELNDAERGDGDSASVVGSPTRNTVGSRTVQTAKNLDSDDSDEEEELMPFPSQPRTLPNPKRPLYLAQCLEGLTQCDDPERMELCLNSVESLVRNCNATTAAEVGVELGRTLLHLDDRYALPDFGVLRFRAMVAVVVVSPNQVAEYLACEFYARNYSIRQRMDILDVLASAATELAEPAKSLKQSLTAPSQAVTAGDALSSHWTEIVRQRLESKTRRFGKARTTAPPSSSVNRFATCAGSFFYPLMRHFDRQTDACLDLLGVDHLLYERLIVAVGTVLMAARNLPCARAMAVAALEFVRCARHHPEVGVRRAVLFAVCAAFVAMPRGSLIDDASSVADLGDWLRAASEHDADPECQSRSAQALMLLGAIVERELSED